MFIKLNSVILDLDNAVIKNDDEELTLKTVCINSLLGAYKDEKIDGVGKNKRFILAMKLHDTDEIDLKSEDIVLLKELIGNSYMPIVVGRAYALLENETKNDKDDKK